MKTNYSGLIIFCVIPAIICYYICRIYVDTRISITLALFAFVSFFTAIFVYMELYKKKFNNIDIPASQIRYRTLATYYTNKLEGDGVLLLTDESLFFIRYKKRRYAKTEIPLDQIHNAFQRTATIVRLQLRNGSGIEFLTSESIAFLNELKSRI